MLQIDRRGVIREARELLRASGEFSFLILLPDAEPRFCIYDELAAHIGDDEEGKTLLKWIAEAMGRHRPDTSVIAVNERKDGSIDVLILWEDWTETVGTMSSYKDES